MVIINISNYAQIICNKNVKNRRKHKGMHKTIENLFSKLYNDFIK